VKPSDILSRDSFLNAIVVNSALGGSTNAPIHLAAIARHAGIELTLADWQDYGHDVPLLVNLQPSGEYLGEDFFHAGGVPAVVGELAASGLIRPGTRTVSGATLLENGLGQRSRNQAVIRPVGDPLMAKAGFAVLTGNLFRSAILKTCVIAPEFRARYLSDPNDPEAFEGAAAVFDGPEDYHARIDDPALGVDERSILVMRGVGPLGYPGSAEVVNMRPPAALIRRGITSLPCIGDGRQSGTSASPSILNASPEAASGGGLALLQTGDRIRVDLKRGRVDMLVDAAELDRRRAALDAAGGYPIPASQTPWQEIQRRLVEPLDAGMVLEPAVKYAGIAQRAGIPRDNH
jgi:dihydroxy-acid dehydratase